MPSPVTTFKKLWEISRLPRGWNYGSGDAPATHVVRLAAISLHHLFTIGATKIDVLPSIGGGISIMASYGEMFAEISICENGKFELVIEQGENEIVDISELDFGELVNALENAGWQSLKSSGSHTHAFTVENTVVSLARPFASMAKVRQSSARPVLRKQAGLFAPISNGITVESEANRQYSSVTKPRSLVLAQG